MTTQQLLEGKLSSCFFRYLSTSVLGMVGMSMYILADTFFIANGVGEIGLTALSIALPVYSIVFGLGLLLGAGGAALCSIARGRGQQEMADRYFSISLFAGVLIGLLLTAAGILFSEQIARIAGATELCFSYVNSYLKIVLCFSPAFILNSILTTFVRNDGQPHISMLSTLVGTLVNIVLDYVFIFPCDWGMSGAALATAVAPIIGIAISATHFMSRKNTLRFRLDGCHLAHVCEIAVCGFPNFIMELSSGVVIFLFNSRILAISGETAVAAYSIVANIAMVCISVFTGIGQAVQPIVSINFGAKKNERIRAVLRLGIISALVTGGILYLTGSIFAAPITAAFNRDGSEQLTAYAIQAIRIYFVGFLSAGASVVFASFYQAIARSRKSMMITLLRGFALIALFLYPLTALLGLRGVWMTVPCAELATLAIALLIYRNDRKGGAL